MPSRSLQVWQGQRLSVLNKLEAVHAAVRASTAFNIRAARYPTEQVNHAYAVLLSSQFQAFCRDLHSEVTDYLVDSLSPPLRSLLRARLTEDRKLDRGNPNPGNLGSDFGRFDFGFWQEVHNASPRAKERQQSLETLNNWRNAIAHQDFDAKKLCGRVSLRLEDVRRWRHACEGLAKTFERVMSAHLVLLVGTPPW